jgi:NTE family protein
MGTPMYDDAIDLLKRHEYFRGISDAILGEIASFAKVTNYDAAAVILQPTDTLTSVSFILRGRLKAVRLDSRGEEHLFRIIEQGDQYGLMLGGLGESFPVRIFALEPSTILRLDYEKAMELTLLHPDLRRQWLQTYARKLRRHLFEPAAARAPKLLAMIHLSPATRNLAQQMIGRLQGLGEAVSVLSDADSWRSIPDVRFRSLLDGDRLIETAEIRRQVAVWNQAKRIVVDITAGQNVDWAMLVGGAECVLVFVRPREISSALERLRALELAAPGLRDKIAIVWLLEEGSGVAPVAPELRDFASREFKICASPLPHPWGRVHATGMERLVHHLRGVKVGVALGGGAARGMAHLGVLNALDQHGIVVDAIAGTSVGAMTGVMYSAGLDCAYLTNAFATDLTPSWIFRHLPSGGYWYLLYKYRRGQWDPMLRKYLHDWKLEQLALPCLSVTADLVSGQAVVRGQGDAVHAVLESINLPGLSAPICRNGQALIDGGVMNNIPADVLISQGCNLVIAVSVTTKIVTQFGANKPETPTLSMRIPSSLQTMLRTLEVQNVSLNAIGVQPAEVVIAPEVADFDLSEFMRAKELFALGEQAALVQIPKIQQLLARLDPVLFRLAQ